MAKKSKINYEQIKKITFQETCHEFGVYPKYFIEFDGDDVIFYSTIDIWIDKSEMLEDNKMLLSLGKPLVIEKLKECNLLRWKKAYWTLDFLTDGLNWQLTIEFLDGIKREIKGSNAFPKKYKKFKWFMQEYIKQDSIKELVSPILT